MLDATGVFLSRGVRLLAVCFSLLFAAETLAAAELGTNEIGDDGREHRPALRHASPDNDPDLPRALRPEDRADYLEKRLEYVNLLRGLPFPAGMRDPRSAAVRQMETQEAKRYGFRARAQYLPAGRKPLLNSTSWSPIGPAPLPNGQTNGTSVAVSGRVTSIAVHPTNPNIVYFGTPEGGLYRSLDGGTTWTPLMDGAQTLAIGSIALDPLNPSTLLVGTGDIEGSNLGGVGVYKITNADGVSPVLSGPFNLDGSSNDVLTGNCVTKILISPTDDNIVLVSTTGPNQGMSSEHFLPSLPSRGLYRSMNFMNGAPTFAKIALTTANGGNRRVTDMVFDPGNANNVILNVGGFANVNSVPDGGLYLLTGALGATPVVTQTLNIDNVKNVKFAINKTGSAVTVFAATEEANGCTSVGGVLRKSTDGGQTWSAPLPAASIAGFCGTQCWYDLAVAVDPTNANRILLGGSYDDTTSPACQSSTQMLSTDGGTTFSRADLQLHPDTHVIAFAPSNPSIVYAGNDGGMFKSADGGATWSSLNGSGFCATEFQSFATHPLDRFFAIGGTQDNGTPMMGTDGVWTRSDFGDGGATVIDQNAGDTNPLLMYHTYYNVTNSIIGYGRVDDLASAHDAGWAFMGYGGWLNGIGNDPSVLFYAPMTAGPGNPNTLYFGTDRLYRSSDGGITMTAVSQGPIVSTYAISSIAVSPQDDGVRIVSLTNGRTFATTNGSSTLTEITGALPAHFPTRVIVDPNNKQTAYIAFSGYGLVAGTHVWKNTNLAGGGANWVASGSGIPDVPVDAIVVDPMNSSNLFAGTDIGVYNSTDGGATWAPFGTGMPRVPVFDLSIQSPSRVLRAATYGRGAWEIAIPGSAYPALSIGKVTASAMSGNSNGVIEPGESASLTIPVTNHGVVTATGVTVTISTSSPDARITSATSAFANIGAGATGSNSTPLTFSIAPGATCGNVVDFVLTLNATGAPTITQRYRLVLGGPSTTPSTFTYAAAPVAIPDNSLTGALVPISVTGIGAPVAKVTVAILGSACNAIAGSPTVGIDHPWVSDLQLYLISPSGTKVALALNAGDTGTNLCDTVFDDGAAVSIATVTAAQAPFTGTFRPQAPLSTFAGESANGTWFLNAVDTYPGATGSVRAFSITITPAVCASVPAAPQNLAARASSTSAADLTWTTVSGADHYEVYRSSSNAAFTLIASPTASAYHDSGLTASMTYLYKVRTVTSAGSTSDYSLVDPATTMLFTDDPIVAGTTVIKAVHLTELQTGVNAMRTSVGLTAVSFAPVTSSMTISASDLIALRNALTSARTAMGLATTYTDTPLVTGSTIVKAVHIQEIRDAIQ